MCRMDCGALSALWVVGPAVDVKVLVTPRHLRQGRTVVRIARDGLAKQKQARFDPFPVPGKRLKEGTQEQVVGSGILCRPLRDAPYFSAATSVGSITPATLIATLSWSSNIS